MKHKLGLTLNLLFLALLLASCRLGSIPTPTDAPPTSDPPAVSFPTSASPSSLPLTPSQPVSPNIPWPTSTYLPSENSTTTPIPGWSTYTNAFLGYVLSYPSKADILERGAGGMDVDEVIPPGFTYEGYFDYVMALLPDNLCVSVSIPGAYITITPPYDPLGSYIGPCPGMGIGTGYTFETAEQTLSIAGREYTASRGTKLFLESSGAFYSEIYIFDLENGFRVIWNGRPTEGMSDATYLTQRAIAIDIIASLHWFHAPDLTKPGTTCAAAFTRLVPGVKALVIGQPGDTPNRVRSGPGAADEIIYQFNPQTVVDILAGPVCTDGLVFWQVESSLLPGGTGWTAEGDGTEYWLEPYRP